MDTSANPAFDYDRDTPPARPQNNTPPDPGPEIVSTYPTDTLRNWRHALRSPIPSDPSFLSALAGAVGMLLDRELTHPGRVKRDKQAAEQRKADAEAAAKPPSEVPAAKVSMPPPNAPTPFDEGQPGRGGDYSGG